MGRPCPRALSLREAMRALVRYSGMSTSHMIASASVHANGKREAPRYERLDAHDQVSVTSLDTSVLVCGCASDALELLPDRCIRTVVTSPPYWSLRDYDVERQIGRDDILADYVGSIVQAFDKVRRVLADDGTVWLNVGDAYTSGNRRYRAPDRKNRGACNVRPAGDPGGTQAEGPDWRPLALGVRASGCGLVAPFGSDLVQAERSPGVGAGPADESARDRVPAVQESGLPLRH